MPISVPQVRPFDLSITDPLKRTQVFWDSLAEGASVRSPPSSPIVPTPSPPITTNPTKDTWGKEFFAVVRPTAAAYINNGKQATVTFALDALPQLFCNGMNNLHGGAVRPPPFPPP